VQTPPRHTSARARPAIDSCPTVCQTNHLPPRRPADVLHIVPSRSDALYPLAPATSRATSWPAAIQLAPPHSTTRRNTPRTCSILRINTPRGALATASILETLVQPPAPLGSQVPRSRHPYRRNRTGHAPSKCTQAPTRLIPSPIAVWAPGTNIGAATPVRIGAPVSFRRRAEHSASLNGSRTAKRADRPRNAQGHDDVPSAPISSTQHQLADLNPRPPMPNWAATPRAVSQPLE